jgi:hypothetical protein
VARDEAVHGLGSDERETHPGTVVSSSVQARVRGLA